MAWVERSGEHSWRVRHRRDGTVVTIPVVFTSEKAANDYAADMATDQRRGTWLDPSGGQTLVGALASDWLDAQDVDRRTEDNKRSILNNHILPRWGATALDDITNLKVQTWRKQLVAGGLAPITADGIVKQLSTMLADFADEKLIIANPIRPRRRGRRRGSARPRKKVWAEPVDVLRFADQVADYYHPSGALLIITSAWTGCRWGELTGLQRPNLTLDDDNGHHLARRDVDDLDNGYGGSGGYVVVDPDIGTLHEDDTGKQWLGPPKTVASERTVSLPPFLAPLLRAHLDAHGHPHVFPTPDFELHRRSNFNRRAVRPCADGNLHIARPRTRLYPVKPGLTFHGLRHSHKTWMIDDGIPEIAQAERLGHIIKDPVRGTYSHVAQAVEERLLQALQDRWDKAVAEIGSTPAWRTIPPTA